MRILVTGASGFVGSHTVRALVQAGHRVRASARSAARVRAALEPHGCADAVEIVEASIADARAVTALLAGCDGVIHAAAVYSHDARRAREALSVNRRGAELVLGTACQLGLDPIVHVSSYVALLDADRWPLRRRRAAERRAPSPAPRVATRGGAAASADGVPAPLTPDSPLGDPPTPYARSKAQSDAVARVLQERGHPVTIVYPGMVWGPHDPAGGESTLLARNVLAGRIPFGAPGAVPVTDVRDLAAVHAALATAGRGPRRYMAAAELVPLTGLMRTLATAGGRRPPLGTMPAAMTVALGRVCELAQRVVPFRLPLDSQGPWAALHGRPLDTTATRADLGVTFRPAAATLADTVGWILGADGRVVAVEEIAGARPARP